jgi:serine/threonine protein kinase/predicted Zn-dependent protease
MAEKPPSDMPLAHEDPDAIHSTLPTRNEALPEDFPPAPVEPESDEKADPIQPTGLDTLMVSEYPFQSPPFVPSTPMLGEEIGPAAPTRPHLGTDYPCVPGYLILGELGEGGMGIVYKARQVRLKRLAALKMIRTSHASRKTRERFRLEWEAVARLQHPNIVQIYEVGEYKNCPFFSLEYIEGGSLERHLDGRPLDARQAAEFILTLARAIQFAHDKGIVHRDLKPANILLAMQNAEGRTPNEKYSIFCTLRSALCIPKIADFGLAKHLDDEEARLSRDGEVMGTPSYMAPEQAAGRTRDVGACTDVYALGAILYELLTGRPPFLAKSADETVKQVCEQDAVPPRQLLGRLPRDLNTICLKCLEKEPRKRYASAAALAEDLRRFLDGEAIHARPVGRLERAAKWTRRHPAQATLIGSILLATIGLAVAIPGHIHLLRTEVSEGKEEINRLNRENLRDRVQHLLEEGRNARARDEWQDARIRFTEVVDNLEAHGDLLDDDLRQRGQKAREELKAVDDLLARQKADRQRQHNYQELLKWRDEAFFLLNSNLFTPQAANPSESIAMADRGLALFGMDGEAVRVPVLDGYSPAEKEEILAGLCELLLIQAEAVARSSAGQTDSQRIERAGKALALLDRVARLSLDDSILHHRRARYLRQQGRPDEAEREQRRAEAVQPQTALGWFLHGYDLGLDQAHRARAIRAFDEALRRRPTLFWAHFFRALAYQKQGNPREAHASLTVCIDRRETFIWNYLLRGLLRIELGDLAAAKTDFDKAETLPLDPASRYVLHLNRGTLAMKEDRQADAIREFQKASQERSDMYQAYLNLAEVYGRQDQLNDAVRWLDQAIEREPSNAGLYRLRALLEQRRRRPKAALHDLEQAIRLTPRDRPSLELARYHFERGAILFLDNQWQAAVRALNDALAVELKLPRGGRAASEADRLRASAHLLRAESLFKLEEYRAARDAFDNYLTIGAPTANVWRQRASINLQLKDYKSVLEDSSKALGLEKNAGALYLRGLAYLQLDRPREAVLDFDEALRLDAKYPEALLGRGLARIKAGDVPQGVADARQAVQWNPKSPEVCWQAARVLAQAVAARSRPGVVAEAEELAEYRAGALALLRQAMEQIRRPDQKGAFWSGKIRRDRALAPIVASAGFRALDQRYHQPQP